MSFDFMFQKAGELYSNGAYVQAEEIYRQILAFAPENADVLNMLGLIAAAKNEHNIAVSYFYKALKNAKYLLPLYFNLAVSLEAIGKHKEALEAYQNALKLAPQTKEIYNNTGAIYEKLNQPDKAAENYRKAIELDENYVDALVNLAVLQKNEAELLRLSQTYPNAALPFYHLALIAYDKSDFATTLDYILKADMLENSYEIKNLTAQVYLKLKDKNKAVTYFHQALLLYKNSTDALINLGVLEQDETYFKKALDINPSSFEAHISYADYLYQEGRKTEALEEYHKAVLINHENPALSNNVALILKDEADYKGALDLFFNAFIKTPDNEDIAVNMAETLVLLHNKEPDEALKIAKLWQKNAPDNIFANHILNAFEHKTDENSALYAKTLFNNFAFSYDKRMQEIGYNILNKIKELNIELKEKVLDLGCGTGLAASRLKAQNTHWTGVDISKEMLKIAQQKNLYDELTEADIQNFLTNNTAYYDTVLCLDVLAYIQNPESVLEKCFPAQLICTIEKAPDHVTAFELSSKGRYQHNSGYILSLLYKVGYRNIKTEPLILRNENNLPVDGYLIIAS